VEASSPLMRFFLIAVLAGYIVFPAVKAHCENTASAVPQDPMALMTLAHDKNGMIGPDLKPWHVHGIYHAYKNGKPEYEGSYEEWWVSPARYKVSFINSKQVQTDYATGTALLRDGTQEWLNGPELLLRGSLVEPLPDPGQLKQFTLVRSEQKVGKAKSRIECVSFTYPVRANLQVTGDFYPAACLEPSLPVLRVFAHGSQRIVYDDLVLFQGHYVAKKILIAINGKPEASLDLDVVELLKGSPETILSAPSSALPVDLSRIEFKESKNQWPALLKRAVPVYPQPAKDRRIEGSVTIQATIGADGHVETAKPIDGPEVLRGASLDAVRQWTYIPLEVLGQPRPFKIEIHVIFSMG
jgi:TonB family protein